MSMLSAQIDELRTMAQLEKSLERPAIARILGDAADTICELRGALQVASVDYRHLADENARLREVVKRMHGHIKENCDTCDGWYCSNFDEDNECCVYDTLVRELGVEVPDGD